MTRGPEGLGRRGFLAGVAASAAVLTALTAGQAFEPLAPLNAFAPRVKGAGPQGLPVTRTAGQAGVTQRSLGSWTFEVTGPRGALAFSRADLEALPQASARLPIACVEGWSTTADWRGVRLRDLLDPVGIASDRVIRIESLQEHGPYRITTMPPEYAQDPLTLVALAVNGADLDLDHGYPARIIAPARPGVLQTKWLRAIREQP